MPDWAFIDTETTGLDPVKHEVIEIAVRRVSHDLTTEVSAFACKIRPERIEDADPKALAINGYTPEGWGEAITLAEALVAIRQHVEGANPAGQNVGFDLGFLAEACKRQGAAPLKMGRRVLDTQVLGLPLWISGEIQGVSLDALCKHFGLPRPSVHRADADVLATIEVARRLTKRPWWVRTKMAVRRLFKK